MKRDARDVIPCQSPEAAPLVAVFSFKDGEIIRRRFAKGESPKQSGGLFWERERLTSEGVPLLQRTIYMPVELPPHTKSKCCCRVRICKYIGPPAAALLLYII